MAEQFITIPAVTSLADLEFKAKTDKRYAQLAILGYRSLAQNRTRVATLKNAMKGLYAIVERDRAFCDSCCNVIRWVNGNRDRIKPEPEPTPIVCSLATEKNNGQKLVDALMKYRKISKKANKAKMIPRIPQRLRRRSI